MHVHISLRVSFSARYLEKFGDEYANLGRARLVPFVW